ncbi:MAG TPA: hypothetical protein DET40_25695 [Lentisphaeria bacterium]|nr:MAG: hypothetical protein A2X45_14780 [Lentisphaerae bacterium GWF2_50_93]HCE46955.1 hypothetical protein [Lentisphaeria bacterium]
MHKPFYIDDIDVLREKLFRAKRDGTLMGRVWDSVIRRSRNAPAQFPWFTPFVALITCEQKDIENAKDAIRNYVATLDPQTFGMGLQFHFWCFAFPHARWSLYFHWLCEIGAWDAAEEKKLKEELLTFQYINFFYGMRTKPEPECVDNQTMSLCFSNALLGHLFSESAMAKRMYVDGIRRLPSLIGGIPTSGYSGEGSTYMDCVVGPSIPFIVELLERSSGESWFDKSLPPHGGSADKVCRMIANEWMSSGLLLPWDHYGYTLPVRSCIAYAAHRSSDPFYGELLERQANWSYDQSIGWGYDDLVWSLIWWPENKKQERAKFASWSEPEVGAALVSDDAQLYLMQMWDESTPVYPTRAHVNPNSLILSAYGSPLTIDGVPDKECTAFKFEDTWREVSYMDIGSSRKFNFGAGCGGAHSVILVDNWEGMRAFTEYRQATMTAFSEKEKSVTSDVTPIYREKFPDAKAVRRRSRLCCERFWLIEDLAVFANEHKVTSRFFLRPNVIGSECGIKIETAEGVRLSLIPLLGPDKMTSTPIKGYPDRLDGESIMVDFTQQGKECRWLWLLWPEATRRTEADVSENWQAIPDAAGNLVLDAAIKLLGANPISIPLTIPPYLQRDLPVVRRWWFRRTINIPAATSWLRLPKQMLNLRMWINGKEIDTSSHKMRMNLMEPDISIPNQLQGNDVEVVLCCDTGYSQYAPDGNGGGGFYGKPLILVEEPVSGIEYAQYKDGAVGIRAGGKDFKVEHDIMEIV